MVETNMIRPLSNEEKRDMIELGTESILVGFLKELAKKQAEYNKILRPYDAYSAKIDFETKVRHKIDELTNTVDEKLKDRNIDYGDLDVYGELSRFTFLEKSPSNVVKSEYGMKKEIQIGNRYKFKCNQRGNKISIFVDNDKVAEFEKWLNNVFLNKEKISTNQVDDEVEVKSSEKPKK